MVSRVTETNIVVEEPKAQFPFDTFSTEYQYAGYRINRDRSKKYISIAANRRVLGSNGDTPDDEGMANHLRAKLDDFDNLKQESIKDIDRFIGPDEEISLKVNRNGSLDAQIRDTSNPDDHPKNHKTSHDISVPQLPALIENPTHKQYILVVTPLVDGRKKMDIVNINDLTKEYKRNFQNKFISVFEKFLNVQAAQPNLKGDILIGETVVMSVTEGKEDVPNYSLVTENGNTYLCVKLKKKVVKIVTPPGFQLKENGELDFDNHIKAFISMTRLLSFIDKEI